ncbi:MAG: hypothetical protein LQ350_004140 [Teloschistes chrysophthalmus]|nr:MAG: hypothetical protein LQ350_004140 [Niorma chrysophthalma]
MSLLPLYHDEECLEAEQRAALSMKGGTGELRQSSNHNQDWLQQIGTAGGHTPMDPWAYNFIPSSGAYSMATYCMVPNASQISHSRPVSPQQSTQQPIQHSSSTTASAPSSISGSQHEQVEHELLLESGDEESFSHEEASSKTAAEIRAEKRKMKRFRLTHNQTRFLMSEFARQAHPDAAQRERLSQEIPGLSPRQVQVWFQNR